MIAKPGDGLLSLPPHSQNDDDVARQTDDERENVSGDDRPKIGIILPRKLHLFRILHWDVGMNSG